MYSQPLWTLPPNNHLVSRSVFSDRRLSSALRGDEERAYLAVTQETAHVRIGLCVLMQLELSSEKAVGTPLQHSRLENPMRGGAW